LLTGREELTVADHGGTSGSLVTMVVWLVVIHELWRRPSAHMTRRQATLFNATTTFTLLISVGTRRPASGVRLLSLLHWS
jgi:hypothetical protein